MGLTNLLIMIGIVMLTSVAQVVMKLGTTGARNAMQTTDVGIIERFVSMLGSPLVLLGLGLYVLAAVVYLRALSELDLSQAYPFVALSYVFTMAAGFIWLGETVHLTRVAGAALILGGVALISWR